MLFVFSSPWLKSDLELDAVDGIFTKCRGSMTGKINRSVIIIHPLSPDSKAFGNINRQRKAPHIASCRDIPPVISNLGVRYAIDEMELRGPAKYGKVIAQVHKAKIRSCVIQFTA